MTQLFFTAIAQVLIIGLVVGAGLPALFALGVRSMAYGAGGDAETGHQVGHPAGRVAGVLIFAVVLAAIALGIAIIVSSGFGYKVSFEHIVPTFIEK
ncbi:hypothetical protein [Agilicoccus flavus]|uniref:hypothetical protein n=1 Tax=Agilicoccus flavus TaxID=2775968 RepID=UPI001CF69F2F|nr:hypothetical protein [Agilicoccus flavus]